LLKGRLEKGISFRRANSEKPFSLNDEEFMGFSN
jgi:hypothetical protein